MATETKLQVWDTGGNHQWGEYTSRDEAQEEARRRLAQGHHVEIHDLLTGETVEIEDDE